MLHHKECAEITCTGAGAIVLLELIELIERKGREITRGLMTIGIDSIKVDQRLVDNMLKPNQHTQDTGAIAAQI